MPFNLKFGPIFLTVNRVMQLSKSRMSPGIGDIALTSPELPTPLLHKEGKKAELRSVEQYPQTWKWNSGPP